MQRLTSRCSQQKSHEGAVLQLAEFSQVDEKGERYALPGEYSALLSLLPAAPPPVSALISSVRSLPLWRRRGARRQTRHGLRGAQDHDGLRATHHRVMEKTLLKDASLCFASRALNDRFGSARPKFESCAARDGAAVAPWRPLDRPD